MNLNLLSGNVKINNRKRPLLWTGQNAQHVAENYNTDSLHCMLHIEIQQCIASAKNSYLTKTKSVYVVDKEIADGTFVGYIQITAKFAIIKTGYKMNTTAESLKKSRNIGSADEECYFPDEWIMMFEDLVNTHGIYSSVEEAKQHFIKIFKKEGKFGFGKKRKRSRK